MNWLHDVAKKLGVFLSKTRSKESFRVSWKNDTAGDGLLQQVGAQLPRRFALHQYEPAVHDRDGMDAAPPAPEMTFEL